MNKTHLYFYLTVASLAAVYFIGEATGYLFFAMLIILPGWVWLLTEPDNNEKY